MIRLLTTAILATTMSWPMPPPAAPVRPVVDSYPDGQSVTDRYRYLEDLKTPEVQTYFRRQADYTNAVLAKLGPARAKLRADIAGLVNAGSSVSAVTLDDNDLFYLERPAGANDARLMVRIGSAAPKLLLDPDALQKKLGVATHLTISAISPSPDSARVAVSIVAGGAERDTHTRFIETATGALLPDDLARSWGGVSAWSADSSTAYYGQLNPVVPGHELDAELNSIARRHVLGSTTPDPAVFGAGVDPKVPFVPTDFPGIGITPTSSWAIGVIGHGVQNEQTIYVAPVSALSADGAIPWRKVADVDDAITSFDILGNRLFLLSHKDAPRYKVTMIDLTASAATAATATTLVPQGAGVIKTVAVAKDALYVRGVQGGLATLQKLPWQNDGSPGTVRTVALPFPGSIGDFTTDSRVEGAVFAFASWTKPLQVYGLNRAAAIVNTGIRKPPAIDTSGYESREVQVPSTAGAMVPVSIILKRGTRLDGTHPAYLEAYGSYGYSIEPYFLGASFAWLDAGGVYVIAHVRGGGENGEDWHLAGKGPTKQHTVDDAVATALYLIANKYTSAKHLAIEGTSAGGIMIGGAITQHPELFAAALDVVGVTDALRSEASQNGAVNTPEFGSVATADGARNLYAMDAYQHIVDGTHYPAVMGITGINDPRVPPWEVAKFVARLAHATASKKPVLLRVDYDAGHGLLGASRAQAVALLTDEFSFLMWQCGSPAYASIPTTITR